jgi:hypothetical protein
MMHMTEQEFRCVRGIFSLLHYHCRFFPDWLSLATSMENTQTRLSSSGSIASQAGEGLAAQSLMARVSKM